MLRYFPHPSRDGVPLDPALFEKARTALVYAEQFLQKSAAFRALSPVKVYIQADSLWPNFSLGGFGHKRKIIIFVDPKFSPLSNPRHPLWGARLIHELGHVVRDRGPGYGKTFGESILSEGLSEACENEIGKVGPYATHLSPAELTAVAEQARPLLDKKTGLQMDRLWFYGANDRPDARPYVKLWSGYALGYAIVHAYRQTYAPTVPASRLLTIDAATILQPFREGKLPLLAHYPTLPNEQKRPKTYYFPHP